MWYISPMKNTPTMKPTHNNQVHIDLLASLEEDAIIVHIFTRATAQEVLDDCGYDHSVSDDEWKNIINTFDHDMGHTAEDFEECVLSVCFPEPATTK